MDLPIYDITLDDWNAGVYAISLVDKPATESEFLHFNKDEERTIWQLADEEKMEVVGALLIPDKPIYRKLEDGTEFYIRFSKEVIVEINEKLNDTFGDKYFTIQHELDARSTIKMTEKWIKETDEDKSVALGINEPIGTLFGKCKISSQLVWDNIKDGKLNGFSVEIDASLIQTELNKHNKNKKMDFNSMFDNSVSIYDNDIELLFNGELAKDTMLFNVEGKDEEAKLMPFSGDFTHEDVEYKVNQGLVTDAKNITLSIEAKIEGLTEELKELKALLSKQEPNEEGETVEQKLDTILTNMENARLKAAQKETSDKDVEKETETRIDTELLSNVKDWGSKWSKKVTKK